MDHCPMVFNGPMVQLEKKQKVRKNKEILFKDWLREKLKNDARFLATPIGDFAGDAQRVQNFPEITKKSNWKTLHTHLRIHGAIPEAIKAGKECFKMFINESNLKPKKEKVDGLGPKEIAKIRTAMRRVWYQSSHARKLCIKRCTDKKGFVFCEKCSKKCPKLFVDHIVNVGDVDGGFIERLWCASSGLQGLCKTCHDQKTKEERKMEKMKKALGF